MVTRKSSLLPPAGEPTRQEDDRTKFHEQKERHGERVGEPVPRLKARELVPARRYLRRAFAGIDLRLVQAVAEEREDRSPDAEDRHTEAHRKRVAQHIGAD